MESVERLRFGTKKETFQMANISDSEND